MLEEQEIKTIIRQGTGHRNAFEFMSHFTLGAVQKIVDRLGLPVDTQREMASIEVHLLRTLDARLKTEKNIGATPSESLELMRIHRHLATAILHHKKARISEEDRQTLQNILHRIEFVNKMLERHSPRVMEFDAGFEAEAKKLAEWRSKQVLGEYFTDYRISYRNAIEEAKSFLRELKKK